MNNKITPPRVNEAYLKVVLLIGITIVGIWSLVEFVSDLTIRYGLIVSAYCISLSIIITILLDVSKEFDRKYDITTPPLPLYPTLIQVLIGICAGYWVFNNLADDQSMRWVLAIGSGLLAYATIMPVITFKVIQQKVWLTQ